MAIKLSGSTIIDDSRNIVNAGIVTATSFDGDGSSLSGIVTSIIAGSGISIDNSTGEVTITASGVGGGSTTFLGLTDTPGSFTASKFLAVNSGGTALEFVDAPSGGGGGISVGTRTGAVDNEDLVTGVTELRFAKAPFTVSDLGGGKVLLLTESSFNPIQVNGAAGVTASGEETLNLVAGDGITIVADNTSSPKKLTFTATGGGGGGASTLGDLTDVDLTTIVPTAGKFLKYDGTNWVPASAPSGGGGGGGDGTAFLGTPSDGSYEGGLVGMTEETQINDAIDSINTLLVKVAPPAPPNLSVKTQTTPMALSPATYSAIQTGTDLARTDVTNLLKPVTAVVTGFYDGDNGRLSFEVDGVEVGSQTLSAASDVGTYGSLTITEDKDPYLGVTGQSDFWKSLSAKGTTPTDLAAGAQHTYQMKHSLTGNSNLLTFFIDQPGSPTVSNTSVDVTTAAADLQYISGVPSYKANSPIYVSTTINGAITKCYNSTKIADITGTQVTTKTIPPATAPSGYTEGGTAAFTAQEVLLKNSVFSDGDFNISVKGYNSKGDAGTASSTSVPGRIDTKSNESSRKTAGSGQYPTSGYGDPYDSTQSLLNNEELQLRDQKYIYPSTDYSTNALAGPNYSGLTGTRWVLFNVGTIGGTFPTASAIINISATGLSSPPTDDTGNLIADMEIYVKVEGGSASTAGWVNANAYYPGSGSPTNNGDAAFNLVEGTSSRTKKTITFGTSGKSGTMYVRIGIPATSSAQITGVTLQ